MIRLHKTILILLLVTFFSSKVVVLADTVTGGGYTVEQIIAPIQGNVSGGGYVLQQSSQVEGGITTGGGYAVQGVFGFTTTTPPPSVTSSGGGGGYFILQQSPALVTGSTSVLQSSVSSCKSRVIFSGPIDSNAVTNNKDDVIKLETFLNIYENETLPVNGVYEKQDIEAVKRWQLKYKSYILDPMFLKKPTGTVYTLSQRQIERQTTSSCGQPVVVTACPYFKEYVSYGDRGDAVKQIQLFLNIVRGEKLPVSGVYGPLTRDATKRFQRAYKKDVFNILKLSFISGAWNEATRIKANQAIGCDTIQ